MFVAYRLLLAVNEPRELAKLLFGGARARFPGGGPRRKLLRRGQRAQARPQSVHFVRTW